MNFARGLGLSTFCGIIFYLITATIVFGQAYYGNTPTPQTTPATQTTYQQQPIFHQPQLTEPTRQQPVLMQTLQTPPKTVIHNGVTVYQQNQQPSPQYQATQYQQTQYRPNETPNRTMPPGYGSPYPTGLDPNAPRVASTQTDPNRQNDTVYNLYGNAPATVPATAQPATGGAYIPPATGPMPPHSVPPQIVPIPGPHREGTQRVHVGRAEPANKIVPFFPTPEEQHELDEFLARWEEYSKSIRRYDVDFELWIYDPTIPGAAQGKPHKRPFGSFKYIAPNRFAYHIEGEWIEGAKLKRDSSRPHIDEEKIIIDGKSVFYYDYSAESVRQINIPPELIGKGIADSPLPLIFGAKAVDMKKRFSMKIVTAPQRQDKEIWLRARPLLIEDQQEFLEIEIRLDKKNLRALALKKDNINGKAHDVYVFENVRINDRINKLFEDLKLFFVPAIPKNWKHEVVDWTPESAPSRQIAGPPAAEQATPRPGIASPVGQSRNEIPLYTPGN